MRTNSAKTMALSGVMAALAVVVMCMGGLIPVATYVCPMICMLILRMINPLIGLRLSWVWYATVSILSSLLGPDKEAAAVFVFLGYYPIIKPKLDQLRISWLWKAIFFNCATVLMYMLLIRLFGMEQLAGEFSQLGSVMTIVLLILGNVTFFLLDKVLSRKFIKRGRYG